MNRSNIRNLRDLAAEKSLLRAKMRIVEEELLSSALRTRHTLEAYVEEKMEIPNQIGQFLKQDAQQSMGTALLRTLMQAVGVNQRWSNALVLLAPAAALYVRKRWQQWRQRKKYVPTADPQDLILPR